MVQQLVKERETKMAEERDVQVHLLPQLAPPGRLAGGLAVAIDVLRATTTILHALAAGCICVRPCAEVEEARVLAGNLPAGKVLLGGERGGKPLPDFDLGNSPREYTSARCKNTTLVFTTTNGTRALLRAAEAERVLVAAFVNFSAVCEQLRQDKRPVHIVCAGTENEITMEDTLLADAPGRLPERGDGNPPQRRRPATTWDCFENHGRMLQAGLELSQGGRHLRELGFQEDISAAAEIDKFNIVPEMKRDPLRLEVGAVGIVKSHWQK